MIHLLSPAKSLDFESQLPIEHHSTPEFLDNSEKLIEKLSGYSLSKVKSLMSISDSLAHLNVERYKQWEGSKEISKTSRQAIYAFTGDVYQGLDAMSLSKTSLEYAQDHLLILSGLYGALRPLDIIEPYRLEMGTKLKVGRPINLYQFWDNKPTDFINLQLKNHQDKTVINLASNEYFKVVNSKKLEGEVISPEFKDAKNGKYKIISFYAKKARGFMSRYIIENKIAHPDDLQGFDLGGYRYNSEMSATLKPVFTREENQQ